MKARRLRKLAYSQLFICLRATVTAVSGAAMCRCSSRYGLKKAGGHGQLTAEADTGSIQAGETRTSGNWGGWGSVKSQRPSPWGLKSSILVEIRTMGETGPA